MMFDLSSGPQTIIITVKSKTPDFFPLLYYSLGNSSHQPAFPPDEHLDYVVYGEEDWD